MYDLVNIGHRIRDERNRKKWLISQLAERTGLSVAHISSIERGRYNFSIEGLIKIASTLNIDVNYLLFGDDFTRNNVPKDILSIIKDCNEHEISIILENAKSLKNILRKNIK